MRRIDITIYLIIYNDYIGVSNSLARTPVCSTHTLPLRFIPGFCVYSVLAFHALKNSDHVFITVFIDFPISSNEDAPCHCITFDYSVADRNGSRDHIRDVFHLGTWVLFIRDVFQL